MCEFLNLNNYTQKTKIGKGAFGKVYLVVENNSGSIYAAKVSKMLLNEERNANIMNLKREVNILSQLSHPSILKFIGYSPTNFDQEPYPVIITEYSSNGSLSNIIELERNSRSPKGWTETKKLINIFGISSAMSYLHKNHIIHRDLKPANILEDDNLYPKIADFGLSKISHQNTNSMSTESTPNFKGTPIYCAPEIWNDFNYSMASDVYAFAMTVYEILTLNEPFKTSHLPTFYTKVVVNGERPALDDSIPDCYQNLIQRCWAQNPDERPMFDEIVEELKTNCEFVTDSIDKEEYQMFIDLIENSESSFNKNKAFNNIVEKTVKTVEDEQKIQSLNKSKVGVDKHSSVQDFCESKVADDQNSVKNLSRARVVENSVLNSSCIIVVSHSINANPATQTADLEGGSIEVVGNNRRSKELVVSDDLDDGGIEIVKRKGKSEADRVVDDLDDGGIEIVECKGSKKQPVVIDDFADDKIEVVHHKPVRVVEDLE